MGGSRKEASLSVEALLGAPGGLLFWGSRRIWRGGLRGQTSLSVGAMLGNLAGGSSIEKALETGTLLHRGPVENRGGSVHWEL